MPDGFCLSPGRTRRHPRNRSLGCRISPDGARRLIDEFFTAIELTARFPHHGMRRPELTGRPLRFELVREFLVAYAPDLNPLLVIAVLDARRNPRVLASILRHRD